MRFILTNRSFMLALSMLFLLLSKHSKGQVELNVTGISQFVPDRWIIVETVEGDLNKDNLLDKVIVIENTDPDNFILNQQLGADTLNINPRKLLVLFQQKIGQYVLAAQNESLIPSAGDIDASCLADPLKEEGGIAIKNGVLKIDLNYWLSCGSYWVSHEAFTFRFQKGAFYLIGIDYFEFSRASGEERKVSINLSTAKRIETKGGNDFEGDDTKKSIETRKIKIKRNYTLDNTPAEMMTDILAWK